MSDYKAKPMPTVNVLRKLSCSGAQKDDKLSRVGKSGFLSLFLSCLIELAPDTIFIHRLLSRKGCIHWAVEYDIN